MTKRIREYDYSEISRILREAADAIESLRERAQAATRGNGECEIVLGEDEMGCTATVCSKCGKPVDDLRSPNFCPYCAARIRRR